MNNDKQKYDISTGRHGEIYYYKKGTFTFHREGGPAVTLSEGTQHWYKEGKLHREDGPAVVSTTHLSWYKEGKLHREDGPAIEYSDGDKSYYLEDVELTEEEFKEEMGMSTAIKKAVKASETIGDIVIGDYINKQVGGDHYKKQSIQPWDYMEATMPEEQFIGYLRGNVLKYVSRYDKKGGIQDIDKAMHYLEKLRSCL